MLSVGAHALEAVGDELLEGDVVRSEASLALGDGVLLSLLSEGSNYIIS